MSKICAICGKPLSSGVVVHPECVQRWIPVENGMKFPAGSEDNQVKFSEVVYATDGVNRYFGYFRQWKYDGMTDFVGVDADDFIDGDTRVIDVTHWIPLPTLPEVE